MVFFKKSKIKSIETTISLLAGYHAVNQDNPDFRKQYRQLFSLLNLLKGQKNV